jgi:hypothetical protein
MPRFGTSLRSAAVLLILSLSSDTNILLSAQPKINKSLVQAGMAESGLDFKNAGTVQL